MQHEPLNCCNIQRCSIGGKVPWSLWNDREVKSWLWFRQA